MADSTSRSLLQRAAHERDPAAWARLLDIYTPLLARWLGRAQVQAHDADDLVQDILAVVHSRLPDFEHNRRTGAFRAWLRQIMVNRMHKYRRDWAAVHGAAPCMDPAQIDQLADPESALSRQWDDEFDQHVLTQALRAVEAEFQPSTWRAFTMTVIERRPTADAAETLGLTANAVRLARARVLQRLRAETADMLDL